MISKNKFYRWLDKKQVENQYLLVMILMALFLGLIIGRFF